MAKPASGTALNTGHALYTSLANAYAFLEGTGGTSADSKSANTATLNHGSWATVSSDPVWRIAAAVSDAITLGSTISIAGTSSWSIAFRMKHSGDTFEGATHSDSAGATLVVTFEGSYLFWRANIGSSDDHTFTGTTSFTTVADYVLTYDHAANRLHLYVNGTEDASSPQIPAGANTQLDVDRLASRGDNGVYGLVGDFHYWYVWSGRVLSGAEATTLAADPYAMFAAAAAAAAMDRPHGSQRPFPFLPSSPRPR